MKYFVKVTMELEVEAKNKTIVRQILKTNKPHRDVSGAGAGIGCYSAKTLPHTFKITSIKERV